MNNIKNHKNYLDSKKRLLPKEDIEIEENKMHNIKTNYQTNKALIFKIIQVAKKDKNNILSRKRTSDDHNKIEKDHTKCHDKYSEDNMTRKLKTKLFADILVIINNSLKEEEEKK